MERMIELIIRGINEKLTIKDDGVVTKLYLDGKLLATYNNLLNDVSLSYDAIEEIDDENPEDTKLLLLAFFKELLDESGGRVDAYPSFARLYWTIIKAVNTIKSVLVKEDKNLALAHLTFDDDEFSLSILDDVKEGMSFDVLERLYIDKLFEDKLIYDVLNETKGSAGLILIDDEIKLIKAEVSAPGGLPKDVIIDALEKDYKGN